MKHEEETTQEALRTLADLLEHVEITQAKVQVKIYPSFLREVADEIDSLHKKKRKKKP
jgi:sulfur carrier protein ThiS